MKRFSASEDAVVRAGFGERSSVAVAGELPGRCAAVVRRRARRLGLGRWKSGLKDYRDYKIARIEPGGRRVTEHRAVMEAVLGRPLTAAERVHHINMRKRDNAPENLFLCGCAGDHQRAHHSLNELVFDLIERGALTFDREVGVYRLAGAV